MIVFIIEFNIAIICPVKCVDEFYLILLGMRVQYQYSRMISDTHTMTRNNMSVAPGELDMI